VKQKIAIRKHVKNRKEDIMRRFKKIIVDKVEYKWLFRLVLQKKCGRNTEEIRKKYRRNFQAEYKWGYQHFDGIKIMQKIGCEILK
jgi:hypothetical protein